MTEGLIVPLQLETDEDNYQNKAYFSSLADFSYQLYFDFNINIFNFL
jgi:hypothetical protein